VSIKIGVRSPRDLSRRHTSRPFGSRMGDVEHDRIDAHRRHVGERGSAAVGGQHLIPVTPQRGGKRLAHSRVVIDNEDPHVIHYARDLADVGTS
jgi:hypothetical protein